MQKLDGDCLSVVQDCEAPLPVYVQPEVMVYEEGELLREISVLGCTAFNEGSF